MAFVLDNRLQKCALTAHNSIPIFVPSQALGLIREATTQIAREWMLIGVAPKGEGVTPKGVRVTDLLIPRTWSHKAHTEAERVFHATDAEHEMPVGLHSHHRMGAWYSGEDRRRINQAFRVSIVVSTSRGKTVFVHDAEYLGFYYVAQVRWTMPCGYISTFEGRIVPTAYYDEFPDWAASAVANVPQGAAAHECPFAQAAEYSFMESNDVVEARCGALLDPSGYAPPHFEGADTTVLLQDTDDNMIPAPDITDGAAFIRAIEAQTLQGVGQNKVWGNKWREQRDKRRAPLGQVPPADQGHLWGDTWGDDYYDSEEESWDIAAEAHEMGFNEGYRAGFERAIEELGLPGDSFDIEALTQAAYDEHGPEMSDDLLLAFGEEDAGWGEDYEFDDPDELDDFAGLDEFEPETEEDASEEDEAPRNPLLPWLRGW